MAHHASTRVLIFDHTQLHNCSACSFAKRCCLLNRTGATVAAGGRSNAWWTTEDGTGGEAGAHGTDVHELLGADIVGVEHKGLVIVIQELEEPGLVLHSMGEMGWATGQHQRPQDRVCRRHRPGLCTFSRVPLRKVGGSWWHTAAQSEQQKTRGAALLREARPRASGKPKL